MPPGTKSPYPTSPQTGSATCTRSSGRVTPSSCSSSCAFPQTQPPPQQPQQQQHSPTISPTRGVVHPCPTTDPKYTQLEDYYTDQNLIRPRGPSIECTNQPLHPFAGKIRPHLYQLLRQSHSAVLQQQQQQCPPQPPAHKWSLPTSTDGTSPPPTHHTAPSPPPPHTHRHTRTHTNVPSVSTHLHTPWQVHTILHTIHQP